MTTSDGLVGLAVLSAKVRSERRILLDRLRTFEKKLLESAEGTRCSGVSNHVTLSTWEHEDSGFCGGIVGWLFFDGVKLSVRTEAYSDCGHDSKYDNQNLDTAQPGWLAQLSAPKILDSLVADISRVLEEEHIFFATANEWLTKFVTAEKAVIDDDLRKQFAQYPNLFDSWLKARGKVEIEPAESITRSCSYLETVLKVYLKQLGDAGYETLPLEKFTARTFKKLRDSGVVDGDAFKSLSGLGTIIHGIGTTRNARPLCNPVRREFYF